MKTIYFFLALLLFSCASEKGLTSVKYNSGKHTYKMMIPKGFKVREIHGGSEWKQGEYIYADSLIFYISDEDGNTSLNYKNIRGNKFQSDKSIMAFFSKDTVTLQGTDKKGNYWKNKYDGKVNIGYLNIPIEKKKEFDKVILSTIEK